MRSETLPDGGFSVCIEFIQLKYKKTLPLGF